VNTVVVAFLISLAVALLLTPLVRHAAVRFGALDHALTSRKTHGQPTPRLGGIAIVVAFYVPLVALFFFDTGVGRLFWSQPERALALILGGLAMAALGIYDDLKGSGARIKFTVQVLIACVMWWAGYRADVVATPFGTLELGFLGFPVKASS
jgi:UDP-GlcNAc:undecaprenyl-phosphate GlcNAc-1-phosphate transferase